jgi:hypothetical protein
LGTRKQLEVFTTGRRNVVLPAVDTPLRIVPFGDIHRHAPACDVDRWKRWCRQAEADDTPYTFYIGLGDYDDLCSASERAILDNPNLHGTTKETWSAWAMEQTLDLCKEIEFMRGRILGLGEGNHYWQFKDGTTSTQAMCDYLKCQWLGTVSYYRLSVSFKTLANRSSIDLFIAHGKSGGKLLGTQVNQVEDMTRITPYADIYIQGHNHKRIAAPSSVLEMVSGKANELVVKDRQQFFCRSGSFLRGYLENTESYVAGGLMRPADLGGILLTVNFERDVPSRRMIKNIVSTV